MRRLYVLVLFVALGLCMAGPSHAETFEETRAKAEQGDADAQCWLGQKYESRKNHEQAMMWYRKAAEQGHAEAQVHLGVMYGEGKGVQLDEAQAAAWFTKAAEQGHAQAQNMIGVMYLEGIGVKQDIAQGYMWYNLAARQKPWGGEMWETESMLLDHLAKRLTPSQIEEGERLTREWLATRPNANSQADEENDAQDCER